MTDGGRSTLTRSRLALGLIVMSATVPGSARAQEGFRFSPSFSAAQVYESNLFSTPVDRQADLIMRVTPGIATERRSTVWTLAGRYSLDIERFADHPALTSMDARQHGILGLGYRPTRRLALDADAEITRTRAPGELNADTGLAYARARAARTTVHSLITRHLDALTSGRLEYTFSQDRVAGAVDIRTHTARVGADRHWSSRDEVSVDYRVQQMLFGFAGAGTSAATSHALSFGWNRAFSRSVRLSLAGGPRVTNGSTAPDLAADVRYHLSPIDLSLAYARTQATVIGLAGTADTQSATAAAAWSLRRSLRIIVSPAFVRSQHAALQATVYRLALDASHPVGRDLSIAFAVVSSTQHGIFYAHLSNDGTIQQQSVMVKLVAEPGVRRHRP
jgi:hypothetical protein